MPKKPPVFRLHLPRSAPRNKQRSYERRRGSSTARGYGYTWQKKRLAYLAENPVCVRCQGPANEVDHIVSKRRGGSDDEENFQSLCKTCHSRKTAREDGRWE